ncbi:MAG: hypothetical protein SGBAC_011730, partial [Bacillariaceae sp.]
MTATAEATEQKKDSFSTKGMADAISSAAPPTKEELLELVRAIKFANEDWSQRLVHKEITEPLALEVSCLKDVNLNDVKK